MKMLRTIVLVVPFGMLSMNLWAGEGHDHRMPGTLPPPPHGGRVGEAKEASEHGHSHAKEEKHEENKEGHSHAEEAELFMEAKLNGDVLSIYALELTEGAKVFSVRAPSEKLKISELKVEYPRSKKSETLSVVAEKGNWTAKVPASRDSRFFAHINVVDSGETKAAKIQIEKHK